MSVRPIQQSWTYHKTLSNTVPVSGSHDGLRDLMSVYEISPHEEADHLDYTSSWTYRIWDSGMFQMAGGIPRDFVSETIEYEEPIVLLAQISKFFDEELELMFIGDFEDRGAELEAEKWTVNESHIHHTRFTNSRGNYSSGYNHTEFDIETVIKECSEYINELDGK